MRLNINGLNLHVEDKGNSGGLPLVFLHSWAGSSRSWKYVVAALPNHLRPIAIDQRGWGRSDTLLRRASSSRTSLLMRRKSSKRSNLIATCLSAIPWAGKSPNLSPPKGLKSYPG